ncbi:MAG: ABC transporter permease [Roseburia sp.]|nr:ABC transporter permease [Roseburia sp.]MCM1241205.1 ABC transporter permease [Roseburia sp.]
MKNNNGASIRKLSDRSLQNNRMRNLFAILAIALTCTLFTAAFSLTGSIMQITQETTMREVGTSGHAGLKHVTRKQYEKITTDTEIKDSNYNILIGTADNILKRSAELRYTPDEKNLESMFITLEEGRLPSERNEIVIDTFLMDELKIPHTLGGRVPISFTFMGQKIEEEFIVCGWYEGDHIAHASECFLSESYWNELKGDLTEEDFIKWGSEHPYDEDVGLLSVSLFFRNSSDIEGKVRSVIEHAGYKPGEEVAYGVNWAYMSSRSAAIDPMSAILLISAILVILITGYLIIYNIFQISVIGDIRFYGLLKTIGTTKKQLRRLIRRQALMLSVIGIPFGLLAGFFISRAILPLISAVNGDSYAALKSSLAPAPWIFLFGAGFSLFTVFLSCRRPGKIAGNVSPIEAVKYTESSGVNPKKKPKKNSRFSPLSMAMSNLGRSKRTTAVVISSISLSVILLALIITAVRSFDLDEFISERIAGDFLLGSTAVTASHLISPAIDPDYPAMADTLPGITDRMEMWVSYGSDILIDDKALTRYQALDAEGKLRRDSFVNENLEEILAGKRPIQGFLYGYDPNLLYHLEIISGTLDIEKFLSGDYILLSTFLGGDSATETDHVYAPGDKVSVEFITEDSTFHEITDESGETIDVIYDNKTPKEYEVMAIVNIPASMNLHRYTANACDAILPLSEFEAGGNNELFAISYQVAEEYQADFEAAVKEYTDNMNPQMGYLSKASLQNEFHTMMFTLSAIGIALAAVIALIGVLNFINAMLTEIISRKREFAMLQSIGMTNKQLQEILICEGLCYIIAAIVISFLLGALLSFGVLSALNQMVLFFAYRFQILPFIIMTPLLLLVAVITPYLAYRRIRSKSIVERLRETE